MPDTPVTLDPAILDRNLSSLADVDAALAREIGAAADRAPESVAALTRDAQINLRLRTSDGKPAWFGQTSVPLARADALLDQFQAGNGNVFLPGIAQGMEVARLVQRLGRHRAVFVWETDAVNLLFALRLHELAGPIRDGRVVFVLTDPERLTEALVDSLAQRPGHLCPDRILMWPWYTLAGIAGCRSSVETAYHQVERQRASRLVELRAQLKAKPASGPADPPVGAVLSMVPTPETQCLAGRLSDAAAEAGWRVTQATIRTPGDVHALARASRLLTEFPHRPAWAVLLDGCRAEMADVLPEQVPAISWFTGQSTMAASIGSRMGPKDRLMATHQAAADRAAELGLARDRIHIRPLPCLVPCDHEPPDWTERSIDIAILTNLAPTDAGSFGHDLSTHVKVWQAALDLLGKQRDTFTEGDIHRILEQAETRAGMRVEDPGGRRHMAELLSGPVATTLAWQSLAQLIAKSGFTASCWGSGWGAIQGVNHCGGLPELAGRQEIYRCAKCTIFVQPTGCVPLDLLLAAASGCAVFWKKHPHDGAPGGASTLLKPGEQAIHFRRHVDIVSQLNRILPSPDAWKSLTHQAFGRCETEHDAGSALRDIQAVASS